MNKRMSRLLPACLLLAALPAASAGSGQRVAWLWSSGSQQAPDAPVPPPAPPADRQTSAPPAVKDRLDGPVVVDIDSLLPDPTPSANAYDPLQPNWQQWGDAERSAQALVDANIPRIGLLPDPLRDEPPALPLLDWPRPGKSSDYGSTTPWLVRGERYTIHTLQLGRRQEGLASWYGPGFQGKRTASGDVFDMNQLTAAHRTLPLPSYLRVTNLANQQSVIVKINDRGPYHSQRFLDLSYAAAQRIGLNSTGRVSIEPVEGEGKVGSQRPGVPIPTDKAYALRIGPFDRPEHADALQSRLLARLPAGVPVTVLPGRQPYDDTQVEIGPLLSLREVNLLVQAIRAHRLGLLVEATLKRPARESTPALPQQSRRRGK